MLLCVLVSSKAGATVRCWPARRPGPPAPWPSAIARPRQARSAVMTGITFKRIAPDESRIHLDGDHVGDVYALDDPLHEGARYFVRASRPKIRAVLVASTTATAYAPCAEKVWSALIRCGGERPCPAGVAFTLGKRHGRCRGNREVWAIPLRGHGLSVAISAPLRFPLRSLSPSVAALPIALRLQAWQSDQCIHSQRLCQSPPPKGSVQVANNYSSDVMDHCATRAHCANPASGGVLHSAALRCGRDSE